MPGITRWLRRTEIRAVHEDQLEAVLRRIELWEPLIAGELQCSICGEVIGEASIGCIIRKDGIFQVACSGLACYMAARDQEANDAS